jgi:hypothetical protein
MGKPSSVAPAIVAGQRSGGAPGGQSVARALALALAGITAGVTAGMGVRWLGPGRRHSSPGVPSIRTNNMPEGDSMSSRLLALVATAAALISFAGAASAQTWTAEQQEVWKVEEQQWKMAAAKDLSWIDTMLHPSVSYWDSGMAMPGSVSSLRRWNRYQNESGAVLEQELFPISITITGNLAVVHYYYQVAREDLKKERTMVTGRYTDVLLKEGGKWRFIAWAGGDDPKKD